MQKSPANGLARLAAMDPAERSRLQGIPYGGVCVDKKMVLNHRYLRGIGMPHSKTVAAVLIPRRKQDKEGKLEALAGVVAGAFRSLRNRLRRAA
jgi:hypothetical protein